MAIHFALVPPGATVFFGGLTNSNALLFTPDNKYLTKFANGDLGIAKHIEQMMMTKNLTTCSSPDTLTAFAKVAKIDLPNPAESYFKNGKISLDPSQFSVNDSTSLAGLRAMERSVIQSIMDSQKPYMDIIGVLTKILVKVEDVIARVLALADSSQKPKTNPLALGFTGNNIQATLGKFSSLKARPLPIATSNSSPSNNGSDNTNNNATQNNNTNPTNTSPNGNNYTYDIVSTVYSTGEFIPGTNYKYQYIDIFSNNIDPDTLSGTDSIDDSYDPYVGLRPDTMVFGIFDSKGNQLDAPDWLIRSGKWFGQFSYLSETNYIWQRGGSEIISPSTPPAQYSSDDRSGWSKKLQSGGANDGQPIVVINAIDSTKYTQYFQEYIQAKLDLDPTNTPAVKADAVTNVMSNVTTVDSTSGTNGVTDYLTSLSLSGYLASVQFAASGTTFPMSKLPFETTKLTVGNNKTIWVDPETEYDMKIIKVDSTIDITYLNVSAAPEVSTEIIRFVRNTLSIIFDDGSNFDVRYLNKNGGTIDTETNISEFILDNWNWDNPNSSPAGPLISKPTNAWTILLTRNNPQDFYKNGYSWSVDNSIGGSASVEYYEVVSDTKSGKYFYNEYTNDFTQINNTNSSPNGDFIVQNGPDGVTKIETSGGSITKWFIGASVSTIAPGTWGTASFMYNWVSVNGLSVTEFSVNYNRLSVISKTGQKSKIGTPAGIKTLQDGTKVSIKSTGEIEYWYIYEGKLDSFLPDDGKRNIQIIRTNDIVFDPIQTVVLPPNQIRVKSTTNPYGKLIDPTQVTNNQLAVDTPYSKGFYGVSTDQQKQDIQQIYRYMKSELDTETYYIVEGIAQEKNTQTGISQNNQNTGQSTPGSNNSGAQYYGKLAALGAIKPFMSILTDIFSKLIPGITALLKLFTNPASFITNILTEKLGNNFSFLSKDFFKDFSKLSTMAPNLRKQFVQGSSLSNFVDVTPAGDFRFLLDGTGITKLFDITFGLELKNLILKLIFKRDPTQFSDTLNSLLGLPNTGSAPAGQTNNSTNQSLGQTDESSTKVITSANGATTETDTIQYSTGTYVPGVQYEYIYVTEYISNLINDADDLIATGDPDNIQTGISNYEQALKSDPTNKFIKDKLDALKKAFSTYTQPILDFLLSLVTMPIKIVKGIIDYIMSLFKSLNLATMPKKIEDFVTFKWIMKFFDPNTLLGFAGIKFDIQKFNGWVANLNSFSADHIFDLSEIVDLPFMPKLFSVNKEEFLNLLKTPMAMLNMILCLLEAIINSIIDFIWSLFSLYVIIPPPHIKLCSDTNNNMSVQDLITLLSGGFTNAGNNPASTTSGTTTGEAGAGSSYNFVYDIKLPDGRNLQDLNRDELQKWINENQDLSLVFNF